ncbi:MAG: hypothetical protein C4289_03940, partial [Chloroflexota bacterium]
RASTSGAGPTPYDVSAGPLGYDICSEAPDGSVRYIEVKARARTGPIALIPNEWLMAQWLGADYWLSVVDQAVTSPQLSRIQDPAARLAPAE